MLPSLPLLPNKSSVQVYDASDIFRGVSLTCPVTTTPRKSLGGMKLRNVTKITKQDSSKSMRDSANVWIYKKIIYIYVLSDVKEVSSGS